MMMIRMSRVDRFNLSRTRRHTSTRFGSVSGDLRVQQKNYVTQSSKCFCVIMKSMKVMYSNLKISLDW